MTYYIDVTAGPANRTNEIRFVVRLAKYSHPSDALKMVVEAVGLHQIDRVEITEE